MIPRRALLWVSFSLGTIFTATILACGASQPLEATTPDLVAPGGDAASSEPEKNADFRPDLPPIPPFETPRHPLRYDDDSWSVYGLRKNIAESMDEELEVTGFVVKVYRPLVCASAGDCPPPAMPHLWFGDDPEESSSRKLVRLVGYAQSHVEIDEAIAQAEAGHDPNAGAEAAGLPPLVYDWQEGRRYVVKAFFTRSSSTGFASSDGVLEYREHRCLDCSE